MSEGDPRGESSLEARSIAVFTLADTGNNNDQPANDRAPIFRARRSSAARMFANRRAISRKSRAHRRRSRGPRANRSSSDRREARPGNLRWRSLVSRSTDRLNAAQRQERGEESTGRSDARVRNDKPSAHSAQVRAVFEQLRAGRKAVFLSPLHRASARRREREMAKRRR